MDIRFLFSRYGLINKTGSIIIPFTLSLILSAWIFLLVLLKICAEGSIREISGW